LKRVTALISIVAALTMILALVPGVALAAEEGSTTGSFQAGNGDPTVSAVGIYLTNHTTVVTSMSPQTEYAVKVTVTDNNTLADLSTVKVTIFYDSDGDDDAGDRPTSGNTQTGAILTCTVGVTPSWSIDPSASTTWSQNATASVQPTLTDMSGDFWFHFKPGKVATEATDWDAYADADDGEGGTHGTLYDGSDYDMNWYGEVTVTGGPVSFGAVTLGQTDIPCTSPVSTTYISNGNYAEQIKTDDGSGDAQWTGAASNVALEETNTPGAGEFVLKADDDNNLTDAVQVKESDYTDIAADEGQTGESGDLTTGNTLWLSLGSTGILPGTYNGTIYYRIANR